MPSIITQCPRCQTSFKVSAKQLAIAEGRVRCGSCLDIFSATENRITIKQPVSETPPADPVESDYEVEEVEEQTSDNDNASLPEPNASITSKHQQALEPRTFALNDSVTLNDGAGQLLDSSTTTVNVTAAPESSPANEDEALDFVLDDEMDDIPLGDMELDDFDLYDPDVSEFEVEEHDELEADEEFPQTEVQPPAARPIEPVSAAEPAPALEEDTGPRYEVNAETTNTAGILAITVADAAFTHEPAAAVESGEVFPDTYAANSLVYAESTIIDGANDQEQNFLVDHESLDAANAPNSPVEARAEQAQEIMAAGPVSYRDDDDNFDTADSFSAEKLSDSDELHLPGFSALSGDETDEDVLSASAPKPQSRHDKEELRQYLAELEDADALETLPTTTMDTIEADPLTFEVGSGFRKYMSTFGWLCLSIILLAVFVLQVVASNLELIQKSPLYSRYLPIFCRVLDCPQPEPATAGIKSFSSQDLLVRSHPDIPDALEVGFIFRNDSELPQAFPLVELNFRNRFSRLIANRLFNPLEYLPPELAALDLMPARSSVQVLLELADPGSEATNYEIIFREDPDNPASPANVR